MSMEPASAAAAGHDRRAGSVERVARRLRDIPARADGDAGAATKRDADSVGPDSDGWRSDASYDTENESKPRGNWRTLGYGQRHPSDRFTRVAIERGANSSCNTDR